MPINNFNQIGISQIQYPNETDIVVPGTVTVNTISPAGIDTDTFLVSDNGEIKSRTGAEVLSDIGGLIPGPTGLQGYTGLSGTGLTGLQGLQGDTGFFGLTGIPGPQGTQGFQGNTGFFGLTGLQGPQGTQGLQGDTGLFGLTGIQGPQGLQGSQGLQGDTGFFGLTGIQGPQGSQGNIGSQGNTGFFGLTGLQGPQGSQGLQGNTGFFGLTGLQGTQGSQGLQGDTGFFGPTGLQGLTGSPGPISNLTPGYLPQAETSTTLADSPVSTDGTNITMTGDMTSYGMRLQENVYTHTLTNILPTNQIYSMDINTSNDAPKLITVAQTGGQTTWLALVNDYYLYSNQSCLRITGGNQNSPFYKAINTDGRLIDVYNDTTGLFSIYGNGDVVIGGVIQLGVLTVNKDISGSPNVGIRESVGNQSVANWTEDPTNSVIRLSGRGTLTAGNTLLAIPAYTGSFGNYKCWFGVLRLFAAVVGGGNTNSAEYRLWAGTCGSLSIQMIESVWYKDGGLPDFISPEVNDVAGATHSSSIRIKNSSGSSADLFYTFEGQVLYPGT